MTTTSFCVVRYTTKHIINSFTPPQTAVLLLLLYLFEEKVSVEKITYLASDSYKVTVLALEFRSHDSKFQATDPT